MTCKNKLKIIEEQLKNTKDENELKLLIDEAYKIVKIDNQKHSLRYINNLNVKLSFFRWNYLPNKYILETKSNFDNNFYENIYKPNNDEEFLKFLILLIRKAYMNKYISKHINDIDRIDLSNECFVFSQLVKDVCDSYNINCDVIKIDAGFSNTHKIFDGCGFHYFNIVTLNNKEYIVDCSYRQFFSFRRNITSCLGLINFDTLNVGYYMTNDKEKRKIAEDLIKDGFIELTENNFKLYLDGFTLSFRNGLFYEQNNGLTLKTNYTYDDYLNLLFKDDDLIKYEGKELLGFQKKPLKNPYFDFKIV